MVSEEKLGRDEKETFFDYETLNKNLEASLMEPANVFIMSDLKPVNHISMKLFLQYTP